MSSRIDTSALISMGADQIERLEVTGGLYYVSGNLDVLLNPRNGLVLVFSNRRNIYYGLYARPEGAFPQNQNAQALVFQMAMNPKDVKSMIFTEFWDTYVKDPEQKGPPGLMSQNDIRRRLGLKPKLKEGSVESYLASYYNKVARVFNSFDEEGLEDHNEASKVHNMLSLRERLVGDDPDFISASPFAVDPPPTSDRDVSDLLQEARKKTIGVIPIDDPDLESKIAASLVGQETNESLIKTFNRVLFDDLRAIAAKVVQVVNSDFRIFAKKTSKLFGVRFKAGKLK